ncbi:hypothetical protein PENSPDRAFT_754609 [Peniophora sp. CONT]|nr:hypothetical protein PENSPDRAFT_754609 [Peniophora sp. CONT]
MATAVKLLYMACRIFGLVTILDLAVLDISVGKLQCSDQADVKIFSIASRLAAVSATTLLFVRVGVVWRWDKRITAVFVLMQAINIALGIYSTVNLQAFYEYIGIETSGCWVVSNGADLPEISTVFATNLGLLCLLLTGLKRWKYGGTFGLWHVLWNQGIIYLIFALIVGIPLIVSTSQHLNGVISTFFTIPSTLFIPIAATRFYRSLTGFEGGQQAYESINLPPPPKMVPAQANPTFQTSSNIRRGDENDANDVGIELRSLSR